jgi:hypothetical protein
MPKKPHSEEQTIAALMQYEAGAKTGETAASWGSAKPFFYLWKRPYAGLDVQASPAAGREPQAEAGCGRSNCGPPDSAGGPVKKLQSLASDGAPLPQRRGAR